MAINFPSNPTQGDTHTDNGVDYQYSGTKWIVFNKAYSYAGTVLNNVNNQTEIDLNTGNFFDLTLSESTTVTFANPPLSGRAQKFQIKFSLASDFEQTITAWNLSTASYDNISFSVAGQDSIPYDIAFRPDGTRMYMVGLNSNSVHQYTLSTAWDLSTASYDNISFSVADQDSIPLGIAFRPDGTRMYMVGNGNDSVYQYTLSTAWDISTASYDNISFLVEDQDTTPLGIAFQPDGTRMFIVGNGNDSVYQYTLSTAWDLSTASYDNISFLVEDQDTTPLGIAFRPDGTQMYMVGNGNDRVYQYTLSTAWDISTASYDNESFSVAGQVASPSGIAFRPDGTRMYMVGLNSDSVHQYTTIGLLPTVTWPTEIVWEAGSAPNLPDLNETDLLEFYTSDSGTTYYGKQAEDNIS